jgi:hypothetical protein
MNNKYLFRKNYKGICEIEGERLSGHLAFKTQNDAWLNTTSPVVVLISVHSAFHNGAEGFLKMEAFLSTIKNCVLGKICLLIADTAHHQAQTLRDGISAWEDCLQSGKALVERYSSLFAECEIFYWHTLCHDEAYAQIRSEILLLIDSDENLQDYLRADADITYTDKRALEFRDKGRFIEATLADLVDQCVVMQLLSQKGYRHLFYPGAPCQATEYLHKMLHNQLRWIDVFLTIEKKTKLPVRILTESCTLG